MKKLLHFFAIIGALSFLTVIPASAVTNGDLDGDGHPYVGLMVALDMDGNPLWRCSGTLISPTIYVTAGHCTEAPAVRATIWFDADVESGIPGNGYPFSGDVFGTTFVSPDYLPQAFFVNDLGVVVLDTPLILGEYAELLTEPGALNALATRRGRQNQTFTAVGYGTGEKFPIPGEETGPANPAGSNIDTFPIRYYADNLTYNAHNPVNDVLRLSMNIAKDENGTCNGDSGGPIFYDDENLGLVQVSLVSGGDAPCRATNTGPGFSRPEAHEFINCGKVAGSADDVMACVADALGQ